MQKQKKTSKPKPKVDLMELLAYNATASSRKLLQKYGMPDADGYPDLQQKLNELYKSQDDKIAIEKDLAAIHPHRDFILKYLCPPQPKTVISLPEPTSAAEGPKETHSAPEPLSPLKDEKFLISAVAIVAIAGITIYALNKK